jgi:hypothetical protein
LVISGRAATSGGAGGPFGCVLPTAPSNTATVPQRAGSRSSRAASAPGQSGEAPLLPEPMIVAWAAKATSVATPRPRASVARRMRTGASASSSAPIAGSSNWVCSRVPPSAAPTVRVTGRAVRAARAIAATAPSRTCARYHSGTKPHAPIRSGPAWEWTVAATIAPAGMRVACAARRRTSSSP